MIPVGLVPGARSGVRLRTDRAAITRHGAAAACVSLRRSAARTHTRRRWGLMVRLSTRSARRCPTAWPPTDSRGRRRSTGWSTACASQSGVAMARGRTNWSRSATPAGRPITCSFISGSSCGARPRHAPCSTARQQPVSSGDKGRHWFPNLFGWPLEWRSRQFGDRVHGDTDARRESSTATRRPRSVSQS